MLSLVGGTGRGVAVECWVISVCILLGHTCIHHSVCHQLWIGRHLIYTPLERHPALHTHPWGIPNCQPRISRTCRSGHVRKPNRVAHTLRVSRDSLAVYQDSVTIDNLHGIPDGKYFIGLKIYKVDNRFHLPGWEAAQIVKTSVIYEDTPRWSPHEFSIQTLRFVCLCRKLFSLGAKLQHYNFSLTVAIGGSGVILTSTLILLPKGKQERKSMVNGCWRQWNIVKLRFGPGQELGNPQSYVII